MSAVQFTSAWRLWGCLLLLPAWMSGADQSAQVIWQKDYSRGKIRSHRIEVSADGKARYELRQGEAEPVVVDFRLEPHTVDFLLEMFAQADFLNRDKNFVSTRRVADTGTRTIRLESGSQSREVVFLYTEDRTLRKIVTFFDQLSDQEKALFEITLALRHDRLGIPRKLDLLEGSLRRKTIVEPRRFAPVLKQISQDHALMNLARKKARSLLRQIGR